MPNKYAAYTTLDFITDEAFQQWVLAPDTASNAFWTSWLLMHPTKKTEVEEAVQFIQSLRFDENYPSDHQVAFALEKSLNKIAEQESTRKISSRKKIIWLGSCIAAALLTATWALHFFAPRAPLEIEEATAAGELRTITLPDSSKVTLNGSSRLRYRSDMPQHREVWLDGEGFFDVQHMKQAGPGAQNFIVHSGDLDIEVLGTRFNVKKENGTTNVSLNSGSIRIGLKGKNETLLSMAPGDFIQYKEAEKKVTRKLVRPELYSVWKEKRLVLEDVPFSDLAQLIRDTYGYEVVYDDPDMTREKISGALYLQNKTDILEAISFALGISYSVENRIVHFQTKSKNK